MLRAPSAFACLVGLGLGVALCVAEEPAIRDVRVGLSGHFKRGHWAEVTAVVSAGSERLVGELEVISRDGDGAAAAFVCPQPVNLAPDESASFSTLVKMGPPGSGLQLHVRTADGNGPRFQLADTALSGERSFRDKLWTNAHRSTAIVVATLGPPVGIEASLDLLSRSLGDEAVAAPLTNSDELPNFHRGYDAIDCLVIVAAQINPLEAVTTERRDALLEWLNLGGKLIVVAGPSAAEMLSPPSPWSGVFSGKLSKQVPLTTDSGLRHFTGESVELTPLPQRWQVEGVPQTWITLGEAGSGSDDQPLIIEYPLGMGQVSLVLVDLTQAPLNHWTGRGRLLARLISGDALASEPEAVRSGGRMTHLGYRDLAGQLRTGLDRYAGVTPVHFYPVAGALLLYLILLGPGEYFLLRKAAPRAMHLTWILFPLILIGFAGGAVALGRSSRGSALKVNHVEIVDLDLVQGRQRGTFWTGLYSPEAQSFSLTANPLTPLADARLTGSQLAWQALPGEGLGGIDVAPLAAGFSEPYALRAGNTSRPASADRLPFSLGSSKMFAGDWWGTIPSAAEASQLRQGKLREIEGTFRVVCPVPLKNAFLAHGDWMYRARDEILPGSVINVANLERKHLEYFFTRRSVLKEKEVSTPWNQEETDVPRIIDVMMFHGALQGRTYTVLSHRYQGDLDLTRLLHQGYAALVGRSETPLVDLESAGDPLDEANVRRWTYYRILYPVASRD